MSMRTKYVKEDLYHNVKKRECLGKLTDRCKGSFFTVPEFRICDSCQSVIERMDYFEHSLSIRNGKVDTRNMEDN